MYSQYSATLPPPYPGYVSVKFSPESQQMGAVHGVSLKYFAIGIVSGGAAVCLWVVTICDAAHYDAADVAASPREHTRRNHSRRAGVSLCVGGKHDRCRPPERSMWRICHGQRRPNGADSVVESRSMVGILSADLLIHVVANAGLQKVGHSRGVGSRGRMVDR
jgi:hypothetical protein